MKRIVTVFLYLLLYNNLFSQLDSSAESFFPHNIGDAWEYNNINSTYQIKLTKDSIIDGSSYLYYNNGDIPYYKIDSSFNVIQYPATPNWINLRINLKAKLHEWWISEDIGGGYKIIGRVDTIYWGSRFGVVTQIKEIGYYYGQQENDTTTFINWRNTDYYAAGFGYFLSQYDAGPPSEQLLGCIINGIKYGIISSVHVKLEDQIFSSYKLYPAFPNPFNPSTIISYQLSENNNVTVKVYDLLGKEVTTLVDKEQEKGAYQFRFEPRGLSSGIYFVRMTAGFFTQTTKVAYAK